MDIGSPVAAFDFDKTLTTTDTLRVHLRRVAGYRLPLVYLRHLHRIIAAAKGGSSRDRAKGHILYSVFAGMAATEAQALAGETALLIEGRLLRPDMVDRLRWHQQQCHRIVIVTASLEDYVVPVMHGLGVNEVIATSLEVDRERVLTGCLAGPNVRGPRKAALLQQHLNGARVEYAYGDSTGDREMLAMAREPTWVTKRVVRGRP